MSRQPPADVVAAARAAHAATHIPASVLLAQWIIESGWGAHMPPGSNNPFGEKAPLDAHEKPIGEHVDVKTREVIHGKTVILVQPFRKYASIADAFMSHALHLATSKHYRAALAKLPDPFDYIDAIAGTYATDPGYAKALKGMVKSQNLIAYDRVSA